MQKSTINKSQKILNLSETSSGRVRVLWIALMFAVFAAYFIALGRAPLFGSDEPRYAEVAREMWMRRDFITPTLGGRVWFEKPVLLYWLMMLSYSIFGVTEFAARFACACAGVLTVLLHGWMGREVSSMLIADCGLRIADCQDAPRATTASSLQIRNPQSAIRNQISFGLICAATAAASGGLLVFARGATFDIILTLTLTATLACFLVAEISNDEMQTKRLRLNLICAGFYTGMGASLLAKGLVGIIIPCGVVALYVILRRKFSGATLMMLRRAWWGVPLGLLVAATWYAPVIARHGDKFINEFFIQHHFARYLSNKYHHPQPFWFYIPVMLGLSLPFTIFLLNAVRGARHWRWRVETTESKLKVFALAWLVFPVAFFSVSVSKLPGYVLPALPGAILLASLAIEHYLHTEAKTKPFTMRATGAIVLLLGIGGGVYAMRELGFGATTLAFILLPALIVGVCVLLLPQRRVLCFAVLVCGTLFIVAGVARTGLERAAERESVRSLLRAATAHGFADAPVYEMHTIERSAEFYAAGRIAYRADGEPVKLEGPTEVEVIARHIAPQSVLVIIPIQYVNQLTNYPSVQAEVIGDNETVALVAVKVR